MTYVLELLDKHIPSITPQDETDMDEALLTSISPTNPDGFDYADFGRRTCSCGTRVVDFYDYHDHLKAVFEKENA